MPQENIERAIKRASESVRRTGGAYVEAYGHGGAAIIMEAISDNRNRTIQEIKMILKEQGGKWAETGSVRWAFEPVTDGHERSWKAKFPQALPKEDAKKLSALVAALEENDDIQKVFTNAG